MHLRVYNGNPVVNLGFCLVLLNHGSEEYRALCEVADSKIHVILGREQSLTVKYVGFPKIYTINAKPEKMIKAVQKEPAKLARSPVMPVLQILNKWQHHLQWKNTSTPNHQRIPSERIMQMYSWG